jgi:hypothetical protein
LDIWRFKLSDLQCKITTTALLSYDGTDVPEGDVEYSDKSGASCVSCDFTGKLKSFTHDGLDSLIEKSQG